MKIGQNRVPNGCRELMQHIGCNRRLANRIKTFNNVPLATMHGSHTPRTLRARFLGFAPNARARLVCGVFASTIRGGMAPGFPRYYFQFARRECSTNSREASKTCLLRGFCPVAGVGLVALPAAGGLEGVAPTARPQAGRAAAVAAVARTASAARAASTARPEAGRAAAVAVVDGPRDAGLHRCGFREDNQSLLTRGRISN